VQAVEDDYTLNKKKSLEWVQRRIKLHLTPIFGGRRLSAIRASDLRAFAAARVKAGASAAEINRELAIVRRAFRLAVKSETYHGHVPAFPMLAENNVRDGFFNQETFQAVYDKLPAALRPVMRFAYVTGWRIHSEVLPLEWRQVDRKAHTIRLNVGSTKNKKGRHIDYSQNADLLAVMDTLWKEHEGLQEAGTIAPLVFQRRGKRIKDFRGAWHKACRAAGVPGRLPHDLRRSAIRHLVRSGVPDTVAMRISGHRTRSVFDRYDITSEADIREGLGKVSEAVGTIRGDNRADAKPDANKQTA
jgi:integrase